MSSHTPPVTVTARWPWTVEERVMIAASLLLPLIILVTTTNHAWWPLPAGLLLAAALYRTGRRRKDTSAVTGTLTDDRLVVTSSGALGDSAVTLSKVESIATRQYGSDQTFLLSGDGSTARVPVRLLHTSPEIAAAFSAVVDRVAVSRDAQDLLDTLNLPR